MIYLGAYGRADAILAPVPARRDIAIGVWQERRVPGFDHDTAELVGPDLELAAEMQRSLDRDEASTQ